jgi:carboxymethylenebutenolidase
MLMDDVLDPNLIPDVNRRVFLTGIGAAMGYAVAAGPVRADPVVTNMFGITAGEVAITGADGVTFPAYVAFPTVRPGPHPTLLVVQEIFGLHEYIRDICRRFAKLGYLAIAPALYARQGDPLAVEDISTIMSDIVARVADAQVMSDLDATADWAFKHGGDVTRLGITGFCWGGRIVWLYAAHSDRLKAGVAWYGRLVGEATPLTPRHPLDIATQIKAPVLGLYGGADQGIPVETVDQMKAALRGAQVPWEIKVYPDTPHGFFADYRPSYREAAAQDGWKKSVEWLQKHHVSLLP